MHIADLGTTLHTEYKQFVAEHPEAAKLAKQGGEKELKTMTEGLRGMPKFQEMSARYSLHMALTQELMKRYQECSLETVAPLEQNMATGRTRRVGAQERAARAARAARAERLASPSTRCVADDLRDHGRHRRRSAASSTTSPASRRRTRWRSSTSTIST